MATKLNWTEFVIGQSLLTVTLNNGEMFIFDNNSFRLIKDEHFNLIAVIDNRGQQITSQNVC